MIRAQCIVTRKNRVLLVKTSLDGREWFCLPGGAVEEGESPLEAALRELNEECLVEGQVIRKTGEWFDDDNTLITFWIDIGEQMPKVGREPELSERVIVDVGWFLLNEISERDRTFLWAAGLLGISEFFEEVNSWSDDISYPLENLTYIR